MQGIGNLSVKKMDLVPASGNSYSSGKERDMVSFKMFLFPLLFPCNLLIMSTGLITLTIFVSSLFISCFQKVGIL